MIRRGSTHHPAAEESDMPSHLRRTALLAALVPALIAVSSAARPAAAALPDGFGDQLVYGPMDRPVGMAFLPDGRLLVIELKTAKVRMLVGGSPAANDPLLTVDSVATAEEEQGLLSIAVDPRWPVKPFVYVHYTALDQTLRLSRFTALGDLDAPASGNLALDPGSRRDLIRDIPDLQGNHNGGTLRFGPDSMLYWSVGEDAYACQAIDSTRLHGVVARMDVRPLPDAPGPPDKALLVPADNPFANRPNVNLRLTWALGLRNPFRFHIDAPTGRVFIADVGWIYYEEVDIADQPGMDFGWPYYEGTQAYVTTECGPLQPAGLAPPAHQYTRAEFCPFPNPLDCAASIIGGVVYRRNPAAPFAFPAEYDGDYFYSEYYDGFLRRLSEDGGSWSIAAPVPGQPATTSWGTGYREVTDYVPGPDGAIYYTRMAYSYQAGTGEVRRIQYSNGGASVPPRGGDLLAFASNPTPARGSATLQWSLAREAPVRLAIFDALGRRVRTLVPESVRGAGEHFVRWDGGTDSGGHVASGVYLARLVVDGRVHELRLPYLR
jgi:glucose/arabinose dehydrogenase